MLARAAAGHRIVTFGRAADADVRLVEEDEHADGGTSCTVEVGERRVQFRVAAPGAHWAVNAAGILAAVDALGGDLAIAGLALADWRQPAGRGRSHRVPLDGGEALLIDESYNANPASMTATLESFGRRSAERRVAVLGGMGELGEGSARFHADLAGPIRAAGIDRLILVGELMTPLARALAEGALDSGPILTQVNDAGAASAALVHLLSPGDAVLVKGSNAIGLDRVVRDAIGAD